MMQQTVSDLLGAAPHEPPDVRYTAEQFAVYKEGYETALLMVMRALKATEQRYDMRERTKRLEARRKAGK